MDAQTLEAHKARLAELVGQIAWKAVAMPAEERAGYVWLTLKRVTAMYAAKFGELDPADDEQLDKHLQAWTMETIRMLETGRDPGLWESIWGSTPA